MGNKLAGLFLLLLNRYLYNLTFVLITLTSTAYLIYRVQIGLDLTDESWIYSSIFQGTNVGMPFGFSMLWHPVVMLVNSNVLFLRYLRLILSIIGIYVLSHSAGKAFLLWQKSQPENIKKISFAMTANAITLKSFTVGTLGLLISYSYLPPFLGYNESVFIFSIYLVAAVLSLYTENIKTNKKIGNIWILRIVIPLLLTTIFIAKFSSGLLAIFLTITVIILVINKKDSLYVVVFLALSSVILSISKSFRAYVKEIRNVLFDPVRAEHLGHSFHEIFNRTSETFSLVFLFGVTIYVTLRIIMNPSKRIGGFIKFGAVFVCGLFLVINTFNRAEMEKGFPKNFYWIQSLMLSVFLVLVITNILLIKKNRKTNQFTVLTFFGIAIAFSQSIGSVNEPWGILSASAPTLFVLLYYSWESFSKNLLIPHISKTLFTFLIIITCLMTYYSGWKLPYRQAPLSASSIELNIGKMNNIFVNQEVANKIKTLKSATDTAKEYGINKLIALDAPILPLIQKDYEIQPIWLSQFWGITPDIIAEQCLARKVNGKQKTGMLIPNGIPVWPQLDDSIYLCGLTIDEIIENSLVIYKSKLINTDTNAKISCNAENFITPGNLGQGWWPSPTNQFWSSEGYVNFTIPKLEKNSSVILDFAKVKPATKITDIEFISNTGTLDLSENQIRIKPNRFDISTHLQLKIENGGRPINFNSKNADVRLLGINLLASRSQC